MRAVLARVKHASVSVDGKITGQIGEGFLVLLGVTHEDTEAQAEKLADKLTGLRIFEDENEKMNRSLTDVGGQLLIVSQFTLYANCKKGRRPEFLAAARPEVAIPLYEKFVQLCRDKGFHTETGEFGAYMQVDSLNDGPLTIILDTDTLYGGHHDHQNTASGPYHDQLLPAVRRGREGLRPDRSRRRCRPGGAAGAPKRLRAQIYPADPRAL